MDEDQMNVWTAGEWRGDGVEQTEIKLKHNIYML